MLATLGVHLLLAWSWRIAHPPAQDQREERVLELIPLPPPTPAQVRSAPPPTRSTVPAAARTRHQSSQLPADGEPEAITPPPPAADPFAVTEPVAPAASTFEAMVGRARRDARDIDRELRKGKPGVTGTADSPWARFTGTLEAAHKDRGLGVTSETYTAPDGQIIYRFRRAGKTMCRSGGSVGPKIGGAVGGGEVLFDVQGGAGRAGEVECPSSAEWKRG